MRDNKKSYLKYGVPSNFADKLIACGLTVTTVRATSIVNLQNKYGLERTEAQLIKQYVTRQEIEESILDALLLNNNFTCCCCLGQKGSSIIVHHIEEYEKSQDNSYNNLALLCPTCHDLAHSQRALTLTVSKSQLHQAKGSWERKCIDKRYGFTISPVIESWQAEFDITEDGFQLNYLCDLSISKASENVIGYFNVTYLNRGNVFMAGEFTHANAGADSNIIIEFWSMQWGMRVTEKSTAKAIVNYVFADTIHIVLIDLVDPLPKYLEFKLLTACFEL